MIFEKPSEAKKALLSKFIGNWSGIVGRDNMLKFHGGTDEEAQEVYEYYLEEVTKLINDESFKRKQEEKKQNKENGKIVM